MSDTQGVVSQSPEPQAHDSKPLQGADLEGLLRLRHFLGSFGKGVEVLICYWLAYPSISQSQMTLAHLRE